MASMALAFALLRFEDRHAARKSMLRNHSLPELKCSILASFLLASPSKQSKLLVPDLCRPASPFPNRNVQFILPLSHTPHVRFVSRTFPLENPSASTPSPTAFPSLLVEDHLLKAKISFSTPTHPFSFALNAVSSILSLTSTNPHHRIASHRIASLTHQVSKHPPSLRQPNSCPLPPFGPTHPSRPSSTHNDPRPPPPSTRSADAEITAPPNLHVAPRPLNSLPS